MGKPIAGRDKFPYGAEGIVVAGAKLQDGTVLTDIRISKQRSVLVFDLLDAGTVHQKLSITSKDQDGKELDVAGEDADLADSLAPGTFFVRAVNTAGVQRGFVVRFQLKKVIVSDGESVFDMDYSKGTDGQVKVDSVSLTPSTLSLVVGGTSQLTFEVLPANATNKAVTFTSSSANATVSSTGLVTAVSAGSATITVTTADGSKTDTTVVTVTAAPAP